MSELGVVFDNRQIQKADAAAAADQFPNELKGADADTAGKRVCAIAQLRQALLQNVSGAGALFPENQPLRKQLFRGNLPPVKGVPRRADADVRLHTQQEMVIALLVENAFQNDEVQLAGLQMGQKMGGVVHQKLQLIVRLGKKPANFRQENIITDGFCGADAQAVFRRGVEGLEQLRLIVTQGNGILLQQRTFPGLFQTAAAVSEQLHGILIFQRLNVLAHRRLRQMQLLCRPSVMHGLTNRQKRFQFLIHIALLS